MTQRYTDERSLKWMAAGLCPECGYLVQQHAEFMGACGLRPDGVKDRIRQYREDAEYKPPSLPTQAIFGTVGKVRVMSYDRNGYFYVLDQWDERRYVHRNNLTFVKS